MLSESSPLLSFNAYPFCPTAFNTLVASFIAFGAYVYVRGPAAGAILYDHWPGLVTASLVNAIIQSLYVYALSFQEEKLLAKGGNTGNHLFDVSAALKAPSVRVADVHVSSYLVVHWPRAQPQNWLL